MKDARIYDDIVFIRKQDIVNNGEIAAVIIEDEATLKRFYYYRDKSLIILKPDNPNFEDISSKARRFFYQMFFSI